MGGRRLVIGDSMSSITKNGTHKEIKVKRIWKLDTTKFLQHNKLHEYANYSYKYSFTGQKSSLAKMIETFIPQLTD